MPIATPNRVADPVQLERYNPPCRLLHGDMEVNYFNPTGYTILQGEPVLVGGRVGIAAATILPNHQGTVYMMWTVEATLNPSLSGTIAQSALVYWDYDLVGVASGIGAVGKNAPTNGFKFGYALMPTDSSLVVSTHAIAASAGDATIRVQNSMELATSYGTVPNFN